MRSVLRRIVSAALITRRSTTRHAHGGVRRKPPQGGWRRAPRLSLQPPMISTAPQRRPPATALVEERAGGRLCSSSASDLVVVYQRVSTVFDTVFEGSSRTSALQAPRPADARLQIGGHRHNHFIRHRDDPHDAQTTGEAQLQSERFDRRAVRILPTDRPRISASLRPSSAVATRPCEGADYAPRRREALCQAL